MSKFIPVDKLKKLREAAAGGDSKAKAILRAQLDGSDFGADLDDYFKVSEADVEKPAIPGKPTEAPHKPITATATAFIDNKPKSKLEIYLEDNEVKPGDPDYDVLVEEFYDQFPEERPEEGGQIFTPAEKHADDNCIDDLIEDEYEAIDGYNKAISKIMRMDQSDSIKRGIIADLEEIRRDEIEHVEKLKRIKNSLEKKEAKELE